ncbi:MAG: histidine--tRNA ligase [Thermoplasmata archaeon]|nr:histidine--tRNA ligase [Thermoplasmata archaeon]
MPFSPLRGFRDYPPPEAGARSDLFGRMRSVARRSGFVELETPSIESLELYQVKSGDEIEKQLWAFTDKGDRSVALAAETTPSLARAFVDRAKSEPLPAKWFTLSRLWRYEEPQAGRTREFTQFNLDILGVPGVEAEVEILATAALVLDACGAEGLYAFRINDRPLAEGLGRDFGARDLPLFFKALDRSRKTSRSEFVASLAAAGLPEPSIEKLRDELSRMHEGLTGDGARAVLQRWGKETTSEAARQGAGRLDRIFELATSAGFADRLFLDLSVVRGFAYYTSTVFEGFDRAGDGRSLFGGGRYDELIGLFGGPATPACGLAIGDQTLELLLRAHGRWPSGEPALDTYIVTVAADLLPVALEIAHGLRTTGQSVDLDLLGRSVSRQLREAARRGARRAILVGPKELARGMVLERDLTTGAQRELPRATPDGRAPPPAPA